MNKLTNTPIVNQAKDFDILLCEEEKNIIKDLELEMVRAWKDGELVFDKDELDIFNSTGMF